MVWFFVYFSISSLYYCDISHYSPKSAVTVVFCVFSHLTTFASTFSTARRGLGRDTAHPGPSSLYQM